VLTGKRDTFEIETSLPTLGVGAEDVTDADLAISAQARSLRDLDRMLEQVSHRLIAPPQAMLDLGCGMGALAVRVARRLGVDRIIGADYDVERLGIAAGRSIETHTVDLDRDRVPIASGSVGLVTCFGVLAYLPTYDNCLAEAARTLEPGGWLMLSMPNLASWTNRLSLLFGYQPAQVAVSRYRRAGTMRPDRRPVGQQAMPPLLHAATLRCMRELLDSYDFDFTLARGFKPKTSGRRPFSRVTARFPSLSRRFFILARKREVTSVVI
jgi:SAM-dependent methyltransferase